MNSLNEIFRSLSILLLLTAATATAQRSSQTIALQGGWNAVYLTVQPEPADCDLVFGATSFTPEQVLTYKQEESAVEIASDAQGLGTISADIGPEWLTWIPTGEVEFDRKLHILRCGRPYLIKLPDNAPPVNWQVEGLAVHKPRAWKGGTFNLVGFRLNPDDSPVTTFSEFFASSAQHATQPIYRMNSQGGWDAPNPATTPMKSGEAFWMYMEESSDHQGPIWLELNGTGLDYGRTLPERTLRIHNDSTIPRTVRVSLRDAPDNTGVVADGGGAGPVPLSYWKADLPNRDIGWMPLDPGPANFIEREIAAGATWILRLEVRRKDLVPDPPPVDQDGNPKNYRSLLDVVEVGGPSIFTLPVIARGKERVDAQGNPLHSFTGLWVGYARLNSVSQPARADNPNTETVDESTASLPVSGSASEFAFRVILHVDRNGTANLLSRAIQMWRDGDDQTGEPGRYVWLSNPARIDDPGLLGATLVDDVRVPRRVTAAAFSFDAPEPLTTSIGNFGSGGAQRSFSLEIQPTDPLNPYRHKYHPDLAEGLDIDRVITLTFAENDPEGGMNPGWCDTVLGGSYHEQISGLHKEDINSEGLFKIFRVAQVPELNDGQPHQK